MNDTSSTGGMPVGIDNTTDLCRALEDARRRQQLTEEGFTKELRSINDKLKSSREALQETNQQLQTSRLTLEQKARELKESQTDMENLLGSVSIAMIFLDVEGRVRHFSPEAAVLFRFLDSDLGRPINDIDHIFGASLDLVHDLRQVLHTRESLQEELLCQHGRWYLRRVETYLGRLGDVVGVVVTFRDINKHKRTSLALRASRARFRTLYDNNPAMYLNLDADNCVVSINRHGMTLLQLDEDDILERDFCEFHNLPGQVREHLAFCRAQNEAHSWEASLQQADGELLWLRTRANRLQSSNGSYELLIVCEDASVEQKLRRQVNFRSAYDEMTGLTNRAWLERSLARARRNASDNGARHALCYLDLDNFRAVNELYGLRTGDDLLRQVAERLRGVSRKSDVLARVGGDDFALLLTHCEWRESRRVAQAMLDAITNAPFECDGNEQVHLTACVGVAPVKAEQTGAAMLLQNAIAACVVAKELGRNALHLFDEDDTALSERQSDLRWASRIRAALAQNRLEVYAQPIVDLANPARICGYETLVRLRDEDGNLCLPGQFLPSASRHGLMTAIDRAVPAHVLAILAEHKNEIADSQWVAINLSGSSLANDGFAEFLSETIARSGVNPRQLCFEITETAVIGNMQYASQFMEKIHALGCKFALDDFGTGLSSFQYLKELPADFIKIDGSFVLDILTTPVDRAVVESINEIAHLKGKKTIAEFVETDSVAEQLRRIGVDMAQGYNYARPAPFEQVIGANKA